MTSPTSHLPKPVSSASGDGPASPPGPAAAGGFAPEYERLPDALPDEVYWAQVCDRATD